MKRILFFVLCLTLTAVCRAEDDDEEASNDAGGDGHADGDGHGHGDHGGHGGHGHGGMNHMKEEWKIIQKELCDPAKADDAMFTDIKKCHPGHGKGGHGEGGKHGDKMKKFNEMIETCQKKCPDEFTKFTNVKDPENQKVIMFRCKDQLSDDFKTCLKEHGGGKHGGGHGGGKHGGGGHGGGKHGGGGHGKGGKQFTDEQKKQWADKIKEIGCCMKKAVKLDASECA